GVHRLGAGSGVDVEVVLVVAAAAGVGADVEDRVADLPRRRRAVARVTGVRSAGETELPSSGDAAVVARRTGRGRAGIGVPEGHRLPARVDVRREDARVTGERAVRIGAVDEPVAVVVRAVQAILGANDASVGEDEGPAVAAIAGRATV